MVDRFILAGIVVLAAIYGYATETLPALEIGDPLGPKAFPRLLTVCLVITGIILVIEMLRKRGHAPKPETKTEPQGRGPYLVIAAVVVWTFLYFLVFEPLGYVIATTIYLFVLTAYFNHRRWIANGVTSVLFCVGSYFMFHVLGVSLARGILPF